MVEPVSHYEVLGVGRDATPDQMRACISAARSGPPSRHQCLGLGRIAGADQRSLAGVGRPGAAAGVRPLARCRRSARGCRLARHRLRRRYLRRCRRRAFRGGSWPASPRSAIGIVLLGVVHVHSRRNQGPPDNVLEQGSCVVIEDNGDAVGSELRRRSRRCRRAASIGDGELCPTPLEPHRDQQGLGVVCVRFDV